MQWFKFEMHIGVEDGVEVPTDPLDFIKWLQGEEVKYLDGLVLRPAKLETAS